MIMTEDEELGDQKSLNASIRSAKKAARPPKIGVPERGGLHTAKKKSKASTKKPRTGGSFESDLSQKSKQREGIRARRDDVVKLGNKGGGKGGNKTKKKVKK
jgi:ATP-dependent RNA helicase DDX27